MKGTTTIALIVLVAMGCCMLSMRAAEPTPLAKRLHPAFEKLKALEGRWAGPATWDQGGKKGRVDFNVTYRTTSGGKTVMETMFAGTPGKW